MKLARENDGVAIQPPRCHIEGMTEKKPKRPRDPNQLAKMIVDIATMGETEAPDTQSLSPGERGKLGGKKGGRARADKLTAEERAASARKAATARWNR